MEHTADAHEIEFVWPWGSETIIKLPVWKPIQVGGVSIDLSPTKHVVMLLFAALLACAILIGAARAHVRHTTMSGRPKGFATGLPTRRCSV